MAHDFDNLLMVMSGNLEILQRHIPTPRLRAALSRARQAVDSGAKLTRQMLSFARRQMIAPEACNINELLEHTWDLLQTATESKVIIERELTSEPIICSVDRGEFELALLNLVINAKQAMTEGGTVTVRSRIVDVAEPQHLSLRPEVPGGRYGMIEIADTGPGMAPEVKAQAFEPFFTTKPHGTGSGLGLSQVYGFALQSGGDVVIGDAPEGGAVFALYLPVTNGQPVSLLSPVAANAPILSGKVLVIEDAAMVRDSVTAMLEDLGCSVMVASDPRQGMHLLRQHCTDLELVVTDILLPGETDGLSLAAFADEHCPQVPVLLMTGHPGETPVSASNRTVLRKPFLINDLAQAIVSARPSVRASAANSISD